MIESNVIRQQIASGQLQKNFIIISENIKKKNIFDSNILPIEYSDLFSFYLFLTKSFPDSEAFVKILEYLDWRDRLSEISSPSSLDHLLGCNVITIFKRMPECHYGYDKNRRPVVYYLFGKHDIHETLKIITRKQIFDYHLWQNDAINELCYHKTLESGTMISSSTLIMDVNDMTSTNVSPEFLHILNRRAEVNGRYFPYLFDRILIINANSTDTKMIRTLKEFCSIYSPRANVYVTGPERNPSDVLSKYIDIDQLPSEYGGLKGSLMNITHPYYDAITFRRSGGGVLPYRKGGVAYTSSPGAVSTPTHGDRKIDKRTSYTTTTIGTSPYDVEDDEFRTHFSTSASVAGTVDGNNDDRTFSTTSSRYVIPNPRYNNRSISMASSHGPSGNNNLMNKTEYLLSNVSMNSMARYTLILFLELFTGSSLPYPSLLFDNMALQHFNGNAQVDATISNASNSPYSSFSKSVDTSLTFQSNNTSTQQFSRYTTHHQLPSQQQQQQRQVGATATAAVGQYQNIPGTSLLSSSSTGTAAAVAATFGLTLTPIISVSLTIKPSLLSLSVDTVLHTSVGNGLGDNTDILCLKTKSGVVSFQASVPQSIQNSNDPSNLHLNSPSRKLSSKRYNGNLIVSNGRVYCLTRGASMSGWLQKWPMRSQAAGSYTHRYFILEDNQLRYWKVDPNSGKGLPGNRASMSSTTPQTPPPEINPKGGMALTANTVIKRSKTLFGSSIIEIKSEYDSITLCAYNPADDSAWFSELYHALERVKKVHRDENSNEQPFPEIVWRQQDPLCIAIDADVIDTSSCEDYYRYRTSMISPPLTITPETYRKTSGQTNLSIHSTDSAPIGMDNNLTYVVLCRVNTGLSSLHSIQIGSYEHVPLRLENNDLDIGVKLLSVKLCGDCLIVSGSNGFVGSGRISQFSGGDNYPNTPINTNMNSSGSVGGNNTALQIDTKRVYIRRFLNNFHGDDSVIQCLATPRYHIHTDNTTGPFNYVETSVSILASGDDIGGLCIWRRDKGATGPTYSIPNKAGGQQTTVRYGYTWTCIHHAKVGHRITSLSFSNDGNYLAVTTLERALFFDMTSLLSSDAPPLIIHNQVNSSLPLNARSQVAPYPLSSHYIPSRDIKTYVLDDCVGHTAEVVFSVDLTTNGFIKIWKIKQGNETGPGTHTSVDDAPNRSESGNNSLASERLGIAPDVIYYTELPVTQILYKNDPYLPLHKLFIHKDHSSSSEKSSSAAGGVGAGGPGAGAGAGGVGGGSDNPAIRYTVGHSSEIHSPLNAPSTSLSTLPPIPSSLLMPPPPQPPPPPPPSASDPPSFFRVDSFGNKVPTTLQSEQSSHHEGSSLSEPIIASIESEEKPSLSNSQQIPNNVIPSSSSTSHMITSRAFLSKQKETGWMIDPFCYADVCVIDPLRMHLRDWWCDYSSRFLLLGHSRIASLTNFEPISLSAHSSLSKSNPLRDDLISASPLSNSSIPGMNNTSTSSSSSSPATGLDRKSTSMFWSTLTSSLGRRVIARYYIPLMYYEKKKHNLDLKPDCLKFILYISRCLYETLGDEYLNSLLIAWKAIVQDEVRNILEKYSSTWFKDITTIHLEILRRFEMSPNIALNCLDELIQFISKTMSTVGSSDDLLFFSSSSTGAGGGGGVGSSSTNPGLGLGVGVGAGLGVGVGLDNSPPLIELQNVLNMLINLRNILCIICDEYGILHLVPSYTQRYLHYGILPLQNDNGSKFKSNKSSSSTSNTAGGGPGGVGAGAGIDSNNYGMPINNWEEEDPIQLLHTLILEPLSYLERTEPFAVALTIVGLQGVPSYIYNNIMGRGGVGVVGTDGSTAGTINDTEVGSNNNEKNSGEKLLLSLQRERKNQNLLIDHQEKGIEGLISLMAKIMPPWIRFILTSDTDKVIL